VAERARMLRAHGSRRKYYNEAIGYNSRLDTLQAALLRVKLPRVDAWNEARRQVASRYNELLAGLLGLVLPEVSEGHVFHQYTVRVLGGKRDEVQRALEAQGIGTMVYYPVPLHRLPVYTHMGLSLPEAERAAQEVLSLPMGPALDLERQVWVTQALEKSVGFL
jgi:dTDP-4-amino-4,6-dideoxygalactose transaminase